MEHPGWILVPWAVFALAAALKAWRLFAGVRQLGRPAVRNTGHDIGRDTGHDTERDTEQFRSRLERSWQRQQLNT